MQGKEDDEISVWEGDGTAPTASVVEGIEELLLVTENWRLPEGESWSNW